MSVINTNVKALVAQESMRSSNLSMSQAMERLSTGSKINNAKDDAAGLAITNRMTSQIRGMAKAIGNVNDSPCLKPLKAPLATSATFCNACANWLCKLAPAP